jgi:hypothetical protein
VAGAAALLLLLSGGGVAAWWFFFRGVPSDLAFVPGDAQGFVTIRMADVWKVDVAKRMAEKVKANPMMGGQDLEKEIGIGPGDIERFTLVFVDAKNDIGWGILATSKAVDQKKTLSQLTNVQEVKHEGKTYQVGKAKSGERIAVYFASDRVVVVAPEAGMKRCLSFMAGKKVKGPLDDAIQLAGGKHHLVAAVVPPAAEMQEAQKAMGPAGAGFKDLLDVRMVTVTGDLSDTLRLDATLKFASDDKAKKSKTAIDGGVAMVRMFMPAQPGGANGKGPLDDVSVEQKGANVLVKVSVDAKALESSMAMMPGPGGPGIGPGPRPPGPGFVPPAGPPPRRPPVRRPKT